MVEVLFVIINVSGSIGYPFRSGFGSDNTHNPIYQKTGSIRYLCRVRIGSDSFLSDRVRFGFSDSVYLPSPMVELLNMAFVCYVDFYKVQYGRVFFRRAITSRVWVSSYNYLDGKAFLQLISMMTSYSVFSNTMIFEDVRGMMCDNY